MGRNRPRVSVTIDPELKAIAEAERISFSRALEYGIEQLVLKISDGENKETINQKKLELEKLKEKKAFGLKLVKEFQELMRDYRALWNEGDDPESDEYFKALVNLKETELGISVNKIFHVCYLIFKGDFRIDRLKNYAREDIEAIELPTYNNVPYELVPKMPATSRGSENIS